MAGRSIEEELAVCYCFDKRKQIVEIKLNDTKERVAFRALIHGSDATRFHGIVRKTGD